MSSACTSNVSDIIPKAYQQKIIQQIKSLRSEIPIPETITREYIDEIQLSTKECIWGSSKRPIYCVTIPSTVIIGCGGVLFTNKTMFLPYDDLIRSEIYYMKSANYYKIGYITCNDEYKGNAVWLFKPKYTETKTEREWYDFCAVTTETPLCNINMLHIEPIIGKRYSSKMSLLEEGCRVGKYVDHVQREILSKILSLNGTKLLPISMISEISSLPPKYALCVSTMIDLTRPVSLTYGAECQRAYHISMLILKLTYILQVFSMKRSTSPVLPKLSSWISFHPRMLKDCINQECWDNVETLCNLAKQDSYPLEFTMSTDPLQELLDSNGLRSVSAPAFTALCSISRDVNCRKAIKVKITNMGRFELLSIVNSMSIKPTPLRQCWTPEAFLSSSVYSSVSSTLSISPASATSLALTEEIIY